MQNKSSTYWESYYAKHRDAAKPSYFAEFVAPFLEKNKSLVEIGCGNGRDSLFFAHQQINVQAIDQCKEEVAYLNEKHSDKANIQFITSDMSLLQDYGQIDYLYSRFSIHSINRDTEAIVFNWAKENLSKGGLFFIEVRSINDELYGEGTEVGQHEFRTDHYRRFIDLEEITALSEKSGFRVLYSIESQGLAPYKEEDPSVIRLILQQD